MHERAGVMGVAAFAAEPVASAPPYFSIYLIFILLSIHHPSFHNSCTKSLRAQIAIIVSNGSQLRDGHTTFSTEKEPAQSWLFFRGGEGGIRTLAGDCSPLSI
jgi:hypothetical protein